jgi:hypothetical protein
LRSKWLVTSFLFKALAPTPCPILAIPQITSRIMFNQPFADGITKNLLDKLFDSVRRFVNPFFLDSLKTACQFYCLDFSNGAKAFAALERMGWIMPASKESRGRPRGNWLVNPRLTPVQNVQNKIGDCPF